MNPAARFSLTNLTSPTRKRGMGGSAQTIPRLRVGLVRERRLVTLHFITPQHAQIADVEPAVGDDRIGPRLGLTADGLLGRFTAAFFPIAFRRGLDQRQFAVVLAMEIQP